MHAYIHTRVEECRHECVLLPLNAAEHLVDGRGVVPGEGPHEHEEQDEGRHEGAAVGRRQQPQQREGHCRQKHER